MSFTSLVLVPHFYSFSTFPNHPSILSAQVHLQSSPSFPLSVPADEHRKVSIQSPALPRECPVQILVLICLEGPVI